MDIIWGHYSDISGGIIGMYLGALYGLSGGIIWISLGAL